jgi:hypothetical protein
MDNLDPHLTILLDDFVRLSPGEAPLEDEDWTGLYEICLFIHEQAIPCTGSSFRDYLFHHGCSARKATFLGQQARHFANILKLRDRRAIAPVPWQRGQGPREALKRAEEARAEHTLYCNGARFA